VKGPAILAAGIALFCATTHLFGQSPQPILDPESYEVYRTLMAKEPQAASSRADVIVLQQETVTNWGCFAKGAVLERAWKPVGAGRSAGSVGLLVDLLSRQSYALSRRARRPAFLARPAGAGSAWARARSTATRR
jgi:hypothetical protein